MSANGISTLMIASGSALTKIATPPHSNTEIVPPYSAIWSVNYTGALGATNNVSYKLYVTSLGIGSAFTLTSHKTGDYAVTAGNFLYDEYGTSLGIIKGNTTIDNYMAKAAAVCGSLSSTIINAATYKGTWNAFSGTPTLTDGVGTLGDAYSVTTSGTNGAYPAYAEQDWRIYDGATWVRVAKTTNTEWTITPATGGLADKEARQIAKLNLAKTNRAAAGNPRANYDITQLPTQYDGTAIIDNTNEGGLVQGRPWAPSQVYTGLTFTYGEATISFTLTSGIFSNVTCPYGAGGYPFGPGVDPVIIMPGNQLIGGTTPANDIYWEYTAVNGVITGFTYRSGNPPWVNLIPGIYKYTYNGDWNNTISNITGATPIGSVVATNFQIASQPNNRSEWFKGYIKSDYTGTWTFNMTSDDASALWIGPNVLNGYTISNALISTSFTDGTITRTINLVAGSYYPIMLMYGNGGGPGSLSLSYSYPGQSTTTSYTNKLFYNPINNGI